MFSARRMGSPTSSKPKIPMDFITIKADEGHMLADTVRSNQ